MTVADFIRGVPTATDAALRQMLTMPDFDDGDGTAHYGMAEAALAELLRRERERCAAVCREIVDERMSSTYACPEYRWEAAGAAECEHRIRGLQ